MLPNIKSALPNLSDDELFDLLDIVSEEVKRRNDLIGPSIPSIREQSAEQNVKMILEALAGIGIQIKTGQ